MTDRLPMPISQENATAFAALTSLQCATLASLTLCSRRPPHCLRRHMWVMHVPVAHACRATGPYHMCAQESLAIAKTECTESIVRCSADVTGRIRPSLLCRVPTECSGERPWEKAHRGLAAETPARGWGPPSTGKEAGDQVDGCEDAGERWLRRCRRTMAAKMPATAGCEDDGERCRHDPPKAGTLVPEPQARRLSLHAFGYVAVGTCGAEPCGALERGSGMRCICGSANIHSDQGPLDRER